MNRFRIHKPMSMIRYALNVPKAIWRKTAFVCLDHEGTPVMGRKEGGVG